MQRWPGNPEYEFRDISYSQKHVAVYHGWLPFYAIAGSFALQHILPDKADRTLAIKHGLSEWKRRTRAARLPGVLFGGCFLLIVFFGARLMYGSDAGWAALIAAAIHPWHFMLSREARYYSAQIALSTACSVLLWLLIKRCTWKSTFAAALGFILLFHTHLLSFCTAVVMFVLIVPLILSRHPGALRKMVVFIACVSLGTLSWIIGTGFYWYQGGVPRAWPMLKLPADILRYPPLTVANTIIGTTVVLVLGVLFLFRKHVSPRFWSPAARLAPVMLYLGAWAACGYAAVLLFMPAVSFATDRLNLSYWGPLLLLESMICAATARVLIPRLSTFAAPVVILSLLFATGSRLRLTDPPNAIWQPQQLIFDRLQALHLRAGTKVFAAPNGHLVLTFYSGLPIQDITPVRKSYLNGYRGDIVFIDSGISVDTGLLTPERIRQAALRYHRDLSLDEAARWGKLIRTRDYREAMLKIVNPDAADQLELLPPFATELLRANDRKASLLFSHAGLDLVTRGFDIHTWTDWRVLLKYRFVDPARHGGVHANYAERLRCAEVIPLPDADSVLYYSRWHPPAEQREDVETERGTSRVR